MIKQFLEKVRGTVRKLWSGSDVKPVKVTVKDLQQNVLRIQEGLKKIQKRIEEQNSRIEKQEILVADLTAKCSEARAKSVNYTSKIADDGSILIDRLVPSKEEMVAERNLRNARGDLEEMKKDLADMHDVYSTLQEEMKLEYENIKKVKDGKFIMAPKDGILIGSMVLVGVFVFSLERENPKAVKIAEFILRLFPMHL